MYNEDTEKIILDCMIMAPASIPKVRERLETDDFYLDKHRQIYDIIKAINDKHTQVTLVSINSYCTDNKIDLQGYIFEILNSWVGGEIENYINDIKDYSNRRRLNKILSDTSQLMQTKDYTLDEACFSIDNALKSITNSQANGLISMKDMSTGKIEDLAESKKFYRTGLRDIDKNIWGIFCGELIVIAARPKSGKTALAGNILCNIAEKYENEHALMFSLEMKKRALRRRFISQYARVDSFLIKTKKYDTEDQKIRIENAMIKVDNLNIHIADNKFRLEEIINSAKRFASYKPISVIVIDYLQLVNHQIKGGNREQVVSDCAREFKIMAGDLNVPVILLSQLSRAVEARPDQKPMLSDLRESGAIEQHADMVWFIYQDKRAKDKLEIAESQYQIEVAANRDGKAGFEVDVTFMKEFTKFYNFMEG